MQRKTTTQTTQEEECSICLESLTRESIFSLAACCGKGIHDKCRDDVIASSMSLEQKNQCVMCRTNYPVSEKEAVEQLRPWVEKGKAWAQCNLGCKYRDGIDGVEQSHQQAAELFELSASQGHAMSQYNLGCMYDNGQGVDQSYERAKEYYEVAARQGYADAQFNLGALYYNGQGVERSDITAREFMMKAAEQGHGNAIKMLQDLDKDEGRTTPSFTPKPFECATCFRPHDSSEHKLRPCNGCHRVYYCGKECQVKHWKEKTNGHKKFCKNGLLQYI